MRGVRSKFMRARTRQTVHLAKRNESTICGERCGPPRAPSLPHVRVHTTTYG